MRKPSAFIALVVLFVLAAAFAPRVSVRAESGPVVLTVSGRIAPDAPREFALAALAALGAQTLRTATPWTEGVQEFTGVRLRDLLAALHAQGTVLALTALNDYTVEIPVSDLDAYDVIVAYRRNGQEMTVRDKGPLWIIYPLDQHSELRTAEYHARMIWQLRQIDVR